MTENPEISPDYLNAIIIYCKGVEKDFPHMSIAMKNIIEMTNKAQNQLMYQSYENF